MHLNVVLKYITVFDSYMKMQKQGDVNSAGRHWFTPDMGYYILLKVNLFLSDLVGLRLENDVGTNKHSH